MPLLLLIRIANATISTLLYAPLGHEERNTRGRPAACYSKQPYQWIYERRYRRC